MNSLLKFAKRVKPLAEVAFCCVDFFMVDCSDFSQYQRDTTIAIVTVVFVINLGLFLPNFRIFIHFICKVIKESTAF
ncbi:hypothetical protein BTV20_08545 [Histophilus somni]|nr:hypothetical protein BTV18_08095 [Histophilus somni]ARU67326.1 hypothetical protein BTV19_08525 [Histophilus somni]ARU69206.1 hypothetical protein BTV16_08540 [Histophilus somni]ARU71083.1 hypothetical protein BTV20_08545 [Histophilus somni]ARU72954.1 hypothetical protein BTV17_08520 [Histophilus somni]